MSAKVATIFAVLFLSLAIIEAAPASAAAPSTLEQAHNGPHVIPPIEVINPNLIEASNASSNAAAPQYKARKLLRRKKIPSNGVKTMAQRDAANADYYYYYYYY